MALNKALYDLDTVPVLLESIRVRCFNESMWLQKTEEWASKATTALEQLTVYYEENENDLEAYKGPTEFRILRSLEKHLELLIGSDDLQKLFKEN